MPNPRIAQLISDNLPNGLVIPGDPSRNEPDIPLVLPAFNPNIAGTPPEYAELISTAVKTLGEAIVHLIETKGESTIVSRTHLEDLESIASDAPEPEILPVHCRKCDPKYQNPLMLLSFDARRRIMIDGKVFLSELAKRNPDCPHVRTP